MNIRTTLRTIRSGNPSISQLTALIVGLNVMMEKTTPTQELTDDTVLHYFEHYPHYMGTKNSSIEITFAELKAANEYFGSDRDDETDFIEDLVNEKENDGETVYSFSELFGDDWGHTWKDVLSALNKTGTWAGQWEEGSHGLSVNSLKEAKAAVAMIETELTEDGDDF